MKGLYNMSQKELFDRHALIEEEIDRVYVNADDEWKKAYYQNAAEFLKRNHLFEGGKICLFCRERGMNEPHHHNVWGAMVTSLKKMGWIEKVGMVVPTTRHTHINAVCQWESKLYRNA